MGDAPHIRRGLRDRGGLSQSASAAASDDPASSDAETGADGRTLPELLESIRALTGLRALDVEAPDAGQERSGARSGGREADAGALWTLEEILGDGDWGAPEEAAEAERLAAQWFAAERARADTQSPAATDDLDADDASEPPAADGVWTQFEAVMRTADETLGRSAVRTRAHRPADPLVPWRRPPLEDPDETPHAPANDAGAEAWADAATPQTAASAQTAAPSQDGAAAQEGARSEDDGEPDAASLDGPASPDVAPDAPLEPEEITALDGSPPRRPPRPDQPVAEPAEPADAAASDAAERDAVAPEPELEPEETASKRAQPAPKARPPRRDAPGPSADDLRRLKRVQDMMTGAMAERRERPKKPPAPPSAAIQAMIGAPLRRGQTASEKGTPAPAAAARDAEPPSAPPERAEPAAKRTPPETPTPRAQTPAAAAPAAPAAEGPGGLTPEMAALLKENLRTLVGQVIREELAKARGDQGEADDAPAR